MFGTRLLASPGAGKPDRRQDRRRDRRGGSVHPKDAFARHNGTAPLPVWSGNKTRHRLARTGNRQINCAIHRIAVSQKRCHRRLSDFVYWMLLADIADTTTAPLGQTA